MFSQKKVLVVEDNELNRAILCQILYDEYDVLQAENGQEALDILEHYGAGISLILLDIVMPVMDGYTFLSKIKSDKNLSAIPVIVMTQNDSESEEVVALSNGAADFVAKPYKPQIILHRVANIINLRETAAMINLIQYDSLTKLYSKEFFYQKIKSVLTANPQKQYDIVCSNIENFKLINDIFGREIGDKLLLYIADTVKKKANGNAIYGRLSADHFVYLLERKWEYTEELFKGENELANKFNLAGSFDVKWGIYEIPDLELSVEQMCDRALLAARSIKGQYGKYFAYYNDEMRSGLIKNKIITDSMEAALANEEFQVYLQPKYMIHNESLAGAEALVRWIHPTFGFMSPADFIPVFEQTGFITKMDQYVWEKTCAIMQSWRQKNLPMIPVSVNVSRADIYNGDMLNFLGQIVNKYGISPSSLHLEITESAYTENQKQLIDTLSKLREMGFIIEMDDFGTGYSSLNMLNSLPIDILKLDMKFIQSETAKRQNLGILNFIIDLARWMNLNVVAEGVETIEQLKILRDIGCDYAQGYLYSKPLPYPQFEELFEHKGDKFLSDQEDAYSLVDSDSYLMDEKKNVVVIIDEDKLRCENMCDILNSRYKTIVNDNKTDAITCIHTNNSIAAVIIGMEQDENESLKFLELLKTDCGSRSIPIMVVGKSKNGTEYSVLRMGADDFISEPYHAESLKLRLLRIIKVAEYKRREHVFKNAAHHDCLTGVLNRRGLDEAATDLYKNNIPFAVYTFDLDDLKLCNDSYGHLLGDELIKRFGMVLGKMTKNSDIIARVGGDEFIVVIKNIQSPEEALKRGEDICAAVRLSIEHEGYKLACSGGVVWDDEKREFVELLSMSDQALYKAKETRKGGCCLWEQNIEHRNIKFGK